MLQLQYILVFLCIVICIEICNSFCFDTHQKIHSHNNNPSPPTSFVRHYQPTQPRAAAASYTTIPLWNSSPITTGTDNEISNTKDDDEDTPNALLDLHSSTISAISNGLYIRSQSNPKMPLRYIDNESMEEWEVTLTAGKVAQEAAEEYIQKHNLNPKENEADEELLQVMAGRVVAVLVRLDELENELLKRCINNSDDVSEERCISLGVPIKELNAYQSSSSPDTAEIIDSICLFDTTIRNNRSKSLLAMFLHDIEQPGLRKNNVKIPCMDVDFLDEDVWDVLFGSNDDSEEAVEFDKDTTADTPEDDILKDGDKKQQPERPSLHPITIDAIEEAFRLRAQNSTTSPLRLINDSMEWFEVQYSVVKFAERFMEKYTKNKSTTQHDWTEEELQTIGGRIVGVLMRLDDLEWEWNHRVTTSSLVDEVESTIWKTTFGLHPDNIEQSCIQTLDKALSEEEDFARVRAERMLGLFLLNVEGPFVEEAMPGGSHPDFIQDELQLKLMAPKAT